MEKYKGIIIKGIGGFYYVEVANATYECKARGIFRKNRITPLVGDTVDISVNEYIMIRARNEKRRFK